MTTSCPPNSTINSNLPDPTWLPPNFCANVYFSLLYKPRGLHIDRVTNEILLVDRGTPTGSKVLRLDSSTEDASKIIATVVAEGGGDYLNHGIELHGGYLYASSPTTVYRWPYTAGQTNASTDRQEVVISMNRENKDDLGAPGGHKTRTLAIDEEGRYLYVSIGSAGNVDNDSFRSRIRRFDISAWDGVTPIEFLDGEVFADGLRNEVGLAFDSFGKLWGVENSADNLMRSDLGGDIHNENPAEELNDFPEEKAGQHWGYPYCWTEFSLPEQDGGMGAGTAWAWPSFMNDGTHTDEWCRENTNPVSVAMQAHSAPLGITFYDWTEQTEGDSSCKDGFPQVMDKYAFVAYHGSWNRDIPTGYKVVYIPFDAEGNPTGDPVDLFRHDSSNAKWPSGIRPVDVQFDRCGRLFVTDDGSGKIFMITYQGNQSDTLEPTASPSASPSLLGSTSPSAALCCSPGPSVSSASAAFNSGSTFHIIWQFITPLLLWFVSRK